MTALRELVRRIGQRRLRSSPSAASSRRSRSHRVQIVEIASPTRIKVLLLEAFDGTPIIDVKPVLDRDRER